MKILAHNKITKGWGLMPRNDKKMNRWGLVPGKGTASVSILTEGNKNNFDYLFDYSSK